MAASIVSCIGGNSGIIGMCRYEGAGQVSGELTVFLLLRGDNTLSVGR